jgi:hypothetical protein
MPYCNNEDCPNREFELTGNIDHMFSGYGWIAQFHPGCCPGDMDGTVCTNEHPDDWRPKHPEAHAKMVARDEKDSEAWIKKCKENGWT